jgi:hypothetical protein
MGSPPRDCVRFLGELGVAVLPVLRRGDSTALETDAHVHMPNVPRSRFWEAAWETLECARDDGVMISISAEKAVRNGLMPLFVSWRQS